MDAPCLFEPAPGASGELEFLSGDVIYKPGFLNAPEATQLFKTLLATIDWRQESMQMYGRAIPLPRETAWYGQGRYTYSKIANPPQPWTPELALLRDRISAAYSANFNSVLLNRYRSGSDSVSWHADDEPELGNRPVIASVSLGEERKFQIRSNNEPKDRIDLVLGHGSLLIMRGLSQRDYKHQIPKVSEVRRTLADRINLTYRLIGTASA